MFGVTTDVLLGKSADEATFVPDAKKDIDNLMFRVFVDSADGDKVRVNLPVTLVKIFAESDDGGDVKINGKNILQGIDLKQLLSLVERGLLGKIVEVTSADGDKIEVVVE